MNKKVIVGFCIVITIVVLISISRNKKNTSLIEENVNQAVQVSEVVKDEETGEYIVYDRETGKEIARSEDKASLHVYTVDPDYNPRSPGVGEN